MSGNDGPEAIEIGWSGPRGDVVAQLSVHGVTVRDSAATVPIVVVAGRRPARAPALPWVWWTTAPAVDEIARAVLDGAVDVIDANAAGAVERLLGRLRQHGAPTSPPATERFVAHDAASRGVLAELWRAAQTSMPVLLTGETGTGKEVSAHLIHEWSARRRQPFVAINCAAIPDDLMEAELFGYQRGAFSGAIHAYGGRLLAGAGGTVFLDEVENTPRSLQHKLLRVLEDRVVSRLGEDHEQTVDFRLIAATNRDLRGLIARGELGLDLYERLAIVSVRLPPLRERRRDIASLAGYFVARFYVEEPAARGRHNVRSIDPACLALLERHRWPGNVRELRNVIFAALVHKAAGDELVVADLPHAVLESSVAVERAVDADGTLHEWARANVLAGGFDLRGAIEELERAALVAALSTTNGNATAAARLLGSVGRGRARDPGSTVRAMMRRLGVGA